MDCYLNRDIEKCAKLARQIADLPEKQQNIHYNKEETRSKPEKILGNSAEKIQEI